MTEKQQFMKQVTILCDTREQKNSHILNKLDSLGVKHERHKLDIGDYSFQICSAILLIEDCSGWDELKAYRVPDWEMQQQNRKVQDIGRRIGDTLQAWCDPSRYGFRVCFSTNPEDTTGHILGAFYWYWHNYKQLIKPLRK